MPSDITESEPIIQYVDGDSNNRFLSVICNPRKVYFRYIALIFMCLLSFGSYFCYDNPAALQDHFKSDLKISTATFTAFYAWYSWPNVVLCFFGGYLIDRVFGIRLGALVFSTFVLSGQLVFAFGALTNHIWLMNIGRFIFG
jgi:MFS family permease